MTFQKWFTFVTPTLPIMLVHVFLHYRVLEMMDKSLPDFLYTAFELEMDKMLLKKGFPKYYARSETKTILPAEISKLGIDLHKMKDDFLVVGQPKDLAGINRSWVYWTGHFSFTVAHVEDFGGVNSYNIILSDGTTKVIQIMYLQSVIVHLMRCMRKFPFNM